MPDLQRRRRRARGAIVSLLGAAALCLLLTGCDPYPFSPIKPVGSVARQDDNLYEIVTVIALAIFAIVAGLIVYSALRFRRPRGAPDEEARQVFGNTPLEMTWTFIPVVIAGLLFALAVQTLQATTVPLAAPKGAITVNVIGHQWVWEYQYPEYHIDYFQQYNQAVPMDGLHIPVNRTVILNITGADVQHGWWVPALAGKNQAIPGHWNHQEFIADKPGTYYAVCSYYCGLQHYDMLANVVVESQASFDQWVAKTRPAATPTPGKTAPTPARPSGAPVSFSRDIETIFTARCVGCHVGGATLGGLNVSTYQGLVKGGSVLPGPVFKAGDHAGSILWKILQPNPPWPGGARMPLSGPPYLTNAQIQTIATWIDQGAKNN